MFIVYLKNAEAARVAQTLRAMLTGGDRRCAAPRGLVGDAGRRRDEHRGDAGGRRRRRWPRGARPSPRRRRRATSFSAGGATIQADPANNALIIMAPEPVYNNLRAIIDKLDVRRAQVFVEALIVEVIGRQGRRVRHPVAGARRRTTRRRRASSAAPTSAPRGSGSNIIDAAVNLGSARRRGSTSASCNGTVTIPGLGTITNLALSRARARDAGQRQHPVDADAADARQRGGADRRRPERAVRHRPVRDDRQYRARCTPFQTIERSDVGLTAAREAADHRGRHGAPRIYQEVSRVDDTHRRRLPASSLSSARSSRRWSSTTARSSCSAG